MGMSSTRERLRYHPDPTRPGGTSGTRRVAERLAVIRDRVDLAGKRVVDLGCSGGYFGFALADTVASYLGLDADAEVIAQNAARAAELGLAGLSFRTQLLTPEFVRALPELDVGLMLSVFHHILTASTAYAWNARPAFEPFGLLRALQERLDVLVFETGYPDEGFDWCARLPPMTPNPRAWTEGVLRDAGFKYVEVIPAVGYGGVLGQGRRLVSEALNVARRRRTAQARLASRLLRLDPRDGRDIFIARNGR